MSLQHWFCKLMPLLHYDLQNLCHYYTMISKLMLLLEHQNHHNKYDICKLKQTL